MGGEGGGGVARGARVTEFFVHKNCFGRGEGWGRWGVGVSDGWTVEQAQTN